MWSRSSIARTAVFALLALVTASVAAAQTGKIGIVDTRRLITQSVAGRAVLADLDKLAGEKSQKLKPMQEEIQALQKKISDGRLSLSEDKLADMQKQVDEKVTSARRLREDLQKEMEDAQQKAFGQFEQKLAPLVEKFGKEQGFLFILNSEFFNQPNLPSGIVWADPKVDVTDQLIQILDAASASQGSTGKPATTPAPPKH